jgi:hypothetical protein
MTSDKIEQLLLKVTAIGSLLLMGLLTASFIILASLLSAFIALPVSAQTRSALDLEAAVTREQVDGDLNAAMTAYQKIAADTSASREVRARALLRLATVYEKLGRQARVVYQRILREFGDQPAAAQARARLAALQRGSLPTAMAQRRIELQEGWSWAETDGHAAVHRDDVTGELLYTDLTNKKHWVVYRAKPDDLWDWKPSRDFSMLALWFRTRPNRPAVLAVIKIDGSGFREVIPSEKAIGPLDEYSLANWSWDGTHLLLNNRAQLVDVTVGTGERRELLDLKTGSLNACAYSPNGREVGCQVSQPGVTEELVPRILIMPASGGDARPAYEGHRGERLSFLDWTADGRNLIIASTRTGRSALYLLPIQNDHASGTPIFVRYGDFEGGITTKSDGLVYWTLKPGGIWRVHTATLDSAGRSGPWQPLTLAGDNHFNPWPQWSPDGNQILYEASQGDAGQFIRLRDLSTGSDREVYRSRNDASCTWAASHPKVFCADWTDSTKSEILSVPLDGGAVEHLGSVKSNPILLRAGADDQALYWISNDEVHQGKTERWEVATGRETMLTDALNRQMAPIVSMDEQWLIRPSHDHHIEVRAVSGGEWRPILPAGGGTGQFATTPDGRWLYFHGLDSTGNRSLFRVEIAGGTPELMGNFPSSHMPGTMDISTAGNQVIVASREQANGSEYWLLENFVPSGLRK